MSENKHPAYSLRPDESVMQKLEFDVAIYIRHLEKELQAAKADLKEETLQLGLKDVTLRSTRVWLKSCEGALADRDKKLKSLRDTTKSKSEWVSATDSKPNDCDIVSVKVNARYKFYKPQSQQAKQGILGRWQLHNGYAWNNTDIEITEFLPTPPTPKEPSR